MKNKNQELIDLLIANPELEIRIANNQIETSDGECPTFKVSEFGKISDLIEIKPKNGNGELIDAILLFFSDSVYYSD